MEVALVVLVVALALGFDYTNGFHDAANAIADRIDETKNSTAPSTMTCVRPHRSASLPPDHAPRGAPGPASHLTRASCST